MKSVLDNKYGGIYYLINSIAVSSTTNMPTNNKPHETCTRTKTICTITHLQFYAESASLIATSRTVPHIKPFTVHLNVAASKTGPQDDGRRPQEGRQRRDVERQ